jgi:adenylate cyclase
MLTVFWKDDEGAHEVPVTHGTSLIGRSPEADLRIANQSVSRRHALLLAGENHWTLRDLGSQNGTSLGGHLVREHRIADGDQAQLGEIMLRFVVSVEDSIRLGDTAQSAQAPSGQDMHPGSIVMSAVQVAESVRSASFPSAAKLSAEISSALGRLAGVANSLMAANSLESLLERVLDVVLDNTPVEHAVLLLHDSAANQLIPKASRSRKGTAEKFGISRDIALRVFQQNESILTLDASSDDRFNSESIMLQGIRSVMCVPLLANGSTLGVIFAGSTTRRVPIMEYHLHLLTIIANIAAVAIEQARLRRQVEEELLLRSRLTRYHSPTLIDELLATGKERDAMQPKEREVSVLFADIAGFSTRSESMAPAAVARMLNGLFSELVEIIFGHEGTLDKFLGDGLMAVFGAPNDLPLHARRAVDCALAMQRRVAELDLRDGTGDPVRLRIGINSGPVVAGDIGSDRRVEYTVLGNTVNVASRLESFVARPGDTVIGPLTMAGLDDSFPVESLGDQTLKGIHAPVAAFRVTA